MESRLSTPHQHHGTLSPSPSSKPPERPCSSARTATPTTPKLGDFSKLLATPLALRFTPVKSQVSDDLTPKPELVQEQEVDLELEDVALNQPTRLGNFSKLFKNLGPSSLVCALPLLSSDLATDVTPFKPSAFTNNKVVAIDINRSGSVVAATTEFKDLFLSTSPSSGQDTDLGITTSPSTPATSPPSPARQALFKVKQDLEPISIPAISSGNESGTDSSRTSNIESKRLRRRLFKAVPDHGQKLFSYQHPPHSGAWKHVHDHMRTKEDKHQSLCTKLVAERFLDTSSRVENGIHVFLDMSNITIGFKRTLMAKYGVGDPCTLKPMPKFNVAFFDELLVRGRDIRGLNAGCSTLPGMQGPYYVHELRGLDYRVDLRNRQIDPAPENKKNSTRFVESMVDETIQIRIAEAVMSDFTNPGTLVIATGDAKPANFSDGFFAYAERALKMGWHVEVVAFSMTMSSAWTRPEFTKAWGSRFRVIDLDDYLDELFACYSE